MPAMEHLYTALAPQGFAIAAVSIDEGDPEDVRRFGRELELSFDLLQDRSQRIQQSYQTTGVPESFLLDREGVIVKRIIGAHDWNSPANRALVGRLLAERGS
jgi:cytochrome c biogenesis protein CcmG/thiol:disulfide interchange protein DsbE